MNLHPTDSSENEDDMSVYSDEGNPDTFFVGIVEVLIINDMKYES